MKVVLVGVVLTKERTIDVERERSCPCSNMDFHSLLRAKMVIPL